MKRRDLLGLCAAAAWAWPAAAGTPSRLRLGAAWRAAAAGSPQHVGVLEVDWAARRLRVAAAVQIPSRAHGLLPMSDGGMTVAALRPGWWLMRLDPDGRVLTRLDIRDEPRERHFAGHVVASPDERWLYTTETDLSDGEGLVGLRDARTLRKLAEWRTHGIEPHQVLRDPRDGSLVVANGGIRRDAFDRKIDLERMDSTLVQIDAEAGRLLGQWRLADRQLSMRHLAFADDGLLGVALQAEHRAPREQLAAPSLALWDGRDLVTAEGGDGYAGDITAVPGGGFVVSHALRDAAWWWHPDAGPRLTRVAQLQRAYALAADNGVMIAAARGLARWHPHEPGAMMGWPEDMALDNHMVVLQPA